LFILPNVGVDDLVEPAFNQCAVSEMMLFLWGSQHAGISDTILCCRVGTWAADTADGADRSHRTYISDRMTKTS
jgi:hypothetical protein